MTRLLQQIFGQGNAVCPKKDWMILKSQDERTM